MSGALAVTIAAALQAAASASEPFTAYGFMPTPSCGNWTSHRSASGRTSEALEGWVMGVVTGYNRYGPAPDGNVARSTDVKGMFAWIDQYCAANPLDNILSATLKLIEELERRERR